MHNRHRTFWIGLNFLLAFTLYVKAGPVIINDIEFKGRFPVPKRTLLEDTNLKRGNSLQKNDFNRALKNIQRSLMKEGYLYARVDSMSLKYGEDSLYVDVSIHGDAGYPVFIGDITIDADSLDSKMYQARLDIPQDQPYSQLYLEKAIQEMLTLAADSGFLHAEVEITNPVIKTEGTRRQADISLHIHENERVVVDDIRFRGNSYTKRFVLLRELPIQPGDAYAQDQVEQMPQRLNKLGILKSVDAPTIILKDRKRIILMIDVEEGNATTFDGVIGYIPGTSASSGDEGFFTGLIDLSLNNLFGTGRRFSVYWKKPDQLSEEFSLGYREPWIMGYPVDAGLALERIVRDSTFIEWQYELNTRLRILENFSIVSRLNRRIALPDSAASRDLRLARNAVLNAEVGVEYDSRDYPVNPRSGVYYRNTYSYGLKENFGPSYLFDEEGINKNERIESIRLQFKWFQQIAFNQVLAVQMTGYKVSASRLQLTDYFWFGGSRSLRGYRENQFRGEVVSWANLEYRFLLGRNSRLFLFNDWGFYQDDRNEGNSERALPGYGVGIRLDTGLGIMGIDYGLGRGDGFGQGKIHFGLINRF